MATYDLGKVSIRPRGAYAANTNYEFLDSVQNLGGGWLALAAVKDVEPGVTSGWQSYWMSLTKGLKDVEITSPATGKATITINFSDGTSTSATIDTAAIGEGAVTGDMIADGAVSLMITGVLSANAWTAEGGGYTQTITANGMLATDTKVIADINPGDKGIADILALTDEWSFITGWTGNNQASVLFSDKPSIDIPIRFLVVRK